MKTLNYKSQRSRSVRQGSRKTVNGFSNGFSTRTTRRGAPHGLPTSFANSAVDQLNYIGFFCTEDTTLDEMIGQDFGIIAAASLHHDLTAKMGLDPHRAPIWLALPGGTTFGAYVMHLAACLKRESVP